MDNLLRDTYLEINLDHISSNIKKLKAYIGDHTTIAVVIKANGYGHGAVEIARIAIENHCQMLAVATLTEAIELRRNFPNFPVLIMGHTPNHLLTKVIEYDLTQTIFTYEQASILNDLSKGTKVKVHLKYDTGFNRLGFKEGQESIVEMIKIYRLANIDVEGVFSHLALKNDQTNKIQYDKFMHAIREMEEAGCPIKYKHLADSISGVDDQDYRLDMVRFGAVIYGLKSYKNTDLVLESALTFKTKVSHLKWIDQGDGVSYDYKWTANKKSLIATLPFGYADGFPRNFVDRPSVTIKGKKLPIIGVICMDQCMVDVTEVASTIQVGDSAIIYGDGTNNTNDINAIANLAGTNKNEIVARLARRLPRVYIYHDEVLKVIDYLVGD